MCLRVFFIFGFGSRVLRLRPPALISALMLCMNWLACVHSIMVMQCRGAKLMLDCKKHRIIALKYALPDACFLLLDA